MKPFVKITAAIVLLGMLGACSDTTATFTDGSTLEMRAVTDKATEYAVAKYTDAKTGKTAVDISRTDSMQARVVPGAVATATGATINAAAGIIIANKNNDKCKHGGCGSGSSVQILNNPVATAGANSGSTSNANAGGGCTTCALLD